ncbi:helix-hairpin-helix domain-containing protein [Lachnospira multipara]|uniref:helix-hairpin-helix domain-containing protein n=1 Tax=Lachnospira multipara TaxID=28051 RepID=UPI0004E0CC51|nr:helix-hairpin-helix domain-containing protein [Lachnospira multipara]
MIISKIYKEYRDWLKIVALVLIFVISGVIYYFSYNNKKLSIDEASDKEFELETVICSEEMTTNNNSKYYVYVCGEVLNPGVYELDSNQRVIDAIKLAGGTLEDANLEALNLATLVKDGEKIYIPSINDLEFETNPSGETSVSSKININTATKDQLMTLPGIGESRALAIIAYRDDKGKFISIEDIKNVSGIKDAAYNKIKDLICV